jgi:hypothetical protein
LSDGPIKLARCNQKKKNFGRHLVELIGEVYSEYMWNSSYISVW